MSQTDYTLLKSRMMTAKVGQKELAASCEMSEKAFSLTVNHKRSFRQSEIDRIVKRLQIPHLAIDKYFFT